MLFDLGRLSFRSREVRFEDFKYPGGGFDVNWSVEGGSSWTGNLFSDRTSSAVRMSCKLDTMLEGLPERINPAIFDNSLL